MFESELGVVPVAEALAGACDPDFADLVGLEGEVLFGLDDFDVDAEEGRAAADDLGGAVDFGDLGDKAGFAEGEGALADGEDGASAE